MLQFVTGDILANKKEAIIERLLMLKEEHADAQFFYLVPEHSKFDMESYVLETIQKRNQSQQAAILDIQVVSFTRLAWFLMPSARRYTMSLSDTGLNMLIRNVLQENKAQLRRYRSQMNHQGFVELLRQQFEEFILGKVEVDDLQQLARKSAQVAEAERLEELAYLFERFLAKLTMHKSAKLDDLVILEQYLQQMPMSHPIYLVVDGYDYFNAQQLNLLMTMAQRFTQVWVTLPLETSNPLVEFDPFTSFIGSTKEQLTMFANQLSIKVDEDWCVTETVKGYRPNILTVAQAFKANQQIQDQMLSAPYAPEHCHSIWQHDSRYQELRHIANHIHQLVSLHGYRYRDILIVGRELDQYARIVPPIFAQNDIPLFFDHAQSMEHYGFVTFLEVLLRFAKRRYHFEDVSILLKSSFWLPKWVRQQEMTQREHALSEYYHQVAMLETVMMANGFIGYRFDDLNYEWFYAERDLPYINAKGEKEVGKTWGDVLQALRKDFVGEMTPALRQRKKCRTGEDFARWFYHWLDETAMIETLIYQRDKAIHDEDLLASRHIEQVWQVLRQTLDEFYTLFQTTDLEYEVFSDLLLTGLQDSTFHVIPPALDQVLLTSIDSPQVVPRKICFVLGADAHTLPRQVKETSLLTDQQREQMAERLLPHQYLVRGRQQSQYEELLRFYRLLLLATDHLYLSFVAMNQGEQVKVSPYISQLASQFHWEIESFSSHSLASAAMLGLHEFGKLETNIQPIYQLIRYYYDRQVTLPSEVGGLLALMEERWPQMWQRLGQLFSFSRLPKNLSPTTAKLLFGETLAGSISKIETYYQDPFSHFLIYGLKIRERQTFDLTPMQTGNYFHELLDQLLAKYPDISQLDSVQLQQLVQKYSEVILSQPQFHIFDLNARMRLIQTLLNERLQQFVKFMKHQQSRILMRPAKTELVFGDRQQSPLVYEFPQGKLLLRGKIDRIDQTADGKYLQVIDYKSGKKEFKLKEFVKGIDLQLMTYLKVALQEVTQKVDSLQREEKKGTHLVQPIGAFYQSLRQQFITVDKELSEAIQIAGTVESEQLKQQSYKGFVTAEPEIMQRIEPSLLEQRKSEVYPLSLKKDLSYTAKTAAYDKKQFEIMQQYMDYLFEQAGKEILSGNIALKPYKDDLYVPSLNRAFRAISGFDATQDYQVYRHFDDSIDLFAYMQEKMKEEGSHDTAGETE